MGTKRQLSFLQLAASLVLTGGPQRATSTPLTGWSRSSCRSLAGGRTDVAQASPDGYTLLLGGTNPNAIAQSLYRNLNFEPLKDFTAVALIGLDSNALVVNPSVPAKTLQELVQYAKANPGKLTSGSTVGIGPHICLELFRARTGTDIAFIPYKGATPAIADLLGG